jgi:hypothetical protein
MESVRPVTTMSLPETYAAEAQGDGMLLLGAWEYLECTLGRGQVVEVLRSSHINSKSLMGRKKASSRVIHMTCTNRKKYK